MITVIVGEGKIVSTIGTSNGFPAVIIENAQQQGVAGQPANREPHEVAEDAIVLEIHGEVGASVIAEDLKNAAKKLVSQEPQE